MHNDKQYETLVNSILVMLRENLHRVNGTFPTIASGQANRIFGASGYAHQIDVSVDHGGLLTLIECKCYSKRKIGTADVLCLASRQIDIESLRGARRVQSTRVSYTSPTKGAVALAKHFGVRIELVKSDSEYGIQIGRYAVNAVKQTVRARDSVYGSVTRKNSK